MMMLTLLLTLFPLALTSRGLPTPWKPPSAASNSTSASNLTAYSAVYVAGAVAAAAAAATGAKAAFTPASSSSLAHSQPTGDGSRRPKAPFQRPYCASGVPSVPSTRLPPASTSELPSTSEREGGRDCDPDDEVPI
eukprot:890397-Pleurochrysis_carterae.AAC.2